MSPKKSEEADDKAPASNVDPGVPAGENGVDASPVNTVNPPEPGDNTGYTGVDPIYQNAANETEQPL